ncbi:MAG: hypothetical protein LBN29_08520 [Mediterranea sp.]|nr:hypothetical protein [Mediterranea sp.]
MKYVMALSLLLINNCLWGQANKSDVPIIIPTFENYQYINNAIPSIYDGQIVDSLKIAYVAIVQFRHPFSDKTKPYIVERVELSKIRLLYPVDKEKGMARFQDEDDLKTIQEKRIWTVCTETLSVWYEHQPYANYYYDRSDLDGKRISFGGALWLKPLKK